MKNTLSQATSCVDLCYQTFIRCVHRTRARLSNQREGKRWKFTLSQGGKSVAGQAPTQSSCTESLLGPDSGDSPVLGWLIVSEASHMCRIRGRRQTKQSPPLFCSFLTHHQFPYCPYSLCSYVSIISSFIISFMLSLFCFFIDSFNHLTSALILTAYYIGN